MAQADLDSEVLRIRDSRSRAYFNDAVRSYRAGALRAALASAWVALVYDILRKYRELASSGDQEAVAFLKTWDTAVQQNNIPKLLETERGILEHAHEKMGLFNAIGLRSLRRLYEDRHLCAHPAFQTNEELFEPSDELVKTHLCAVIDLVLAHRPIQGRGILEAFSRDIVSAGFPTAQGTVADYVEQKYLAQMRDGIARNFGVVLAKALVRGVPQDWQPVRQRVLGALLALKARRPSAWEAVSIELIRLIDDDVPADRLRAIGTLSSFPELATKLSNATVTALSQTVAATPDISKHPEAFAAATLDGIGTSLVSRFKDLEDDEAAAVLSSAAPPQLWPNALQRYSEAGSFRGAEYRFERFIVPFQASVDTAELDQLLAVIPENGQIWDASGTPDLLLKFLQGVQPKRPSGAGVTAMYQALSYRRDRFEDVWKLQEAHGWKRPAIGGGE